MKKTKQTMLTAAVLSAALAMQGKSSVPEWFEDINQDGEYDSEDLKILEHYFLDRALTSSEENSAQVTEPVSEDSNDD